MLGEVSSALLARITILYVLHCVVELIRDVFAFPKTSKLSRFASEILLGRCVLFGSFVFFVFYCRGFIFLNDSNQNEIEHSHLIIV